jgi:hypothetical protein
VRPEVHRVLLVDVGVGRAVDRAEPLLGGRAVVEGTVEPTVQLPGAVDGGTDARPVGEVHDDGVGDSAVGADLPDDLVEGVGAAGGEHDRGALPGEERGRGRPDAAAGARDEHDLAGQQADRAGVDVVGHACSVCPAGIRIQAQTVLGFGAEIRAE